MDTKLNRINVYAISFWIALLSFICLSAFVSYLCFQYHIFQYQLDIQLFRTDIAYFQSFIDAPGGLLRYFSSFLTQSYHYPLGGVIIFTLSNLILSLTFLNICRRYDDIYKYFSLPLILPLLSLFVYNDSNGAFFLLYHLWGMILPILFFLIYICYEEYKHILGVFFLMLTYFIAGGNCFILLLLILIDEAFSKKHTYLTLFLMLFTVCLLPFIAYKYIYVVSLKEAYLSLTPFVMDVPIKSYTVLWIAIPVIFAIWLLLLKMPKLLGLKLPLLLFLNFAIILGIAAKGINNFNKKDIEKLSQVSYEVENANWDKVLELTNDIQEKDNPLFTYFRNIAFSERGELINNLFEYRQTGTYGLFDSWKLHFNTTFAIGEFYYRLGVPAIAEMCAFESMVTSPYEHSAKAMKRIVQTNIIRKDVEGFEKYIKLFEKSPIYKDWAKEQRIQFETLLEDSTCNIPNFPEQLEYNNFFFNAETQEQNLFSLMKLNPDNRKVFEYTAAFLLLRKNLFELQDLMDNYYLNMHYTTMPKVFEEALIILVYNDREDLVERYNIPYKSLESFVQFNKEMTEAKKNSRKFDALTKKYQNSYWLYFKFRQPMLIEEMSNKSVY